MYLGTTSSVPKDVSNFDDTPLYVEKLLATLGSTITVFRALANFTNGGLPYCFDSHSGIKNLTLQDLSPTSKSRWSALGKLLE